MPPCPPSQPRPSRLVRPAPHPAQEHAQASICADFCIKRHLAQSHRTEASSIALQTGRVEQPQNVHREHAIHILCKAPRGPRRKQGGRQGADKPAGQAWPRAPWRAPRPGAHLRSCAQGAQNVHTQVAGGRSVWSRGWQGAASLEGEHARSLLGLGALLGLALLLQRAALGHPGRRVIHLRRRLAQRLRRAQLRLLHPLLPLPATTQYPSGQIYGTSLPRLPQVHAFRVTSQL